MKANKEDKQNKLFHNIKARYSSFRRRLKCKCPECEEGRLSQYDGHWMSGTIANVYKCDKCGETFI